MIEVKKEGVILEPTNLEFENQAVLNPACVQKGNIVHMFYRAVRQGNHSTVGYCKLDGPLKVVKRKTKPVIVPEFEYEKQGIEDPRIVLFNGKYYLFYTAFDGKNAMAAYAVSKDLKKWQKKGTITPKMTYDKAEDIFRKSKSKLKEKYFFFESYYKDIVAKDVLLWEKDVFIFPKKFNNKYALVHRILPDIQVAYFNNFKELSSDYWEEYLENLGDYVILEPKHGYESRNIGGGAPVIETEKGWLMIYHAVEDTNKGKIYHASAALLDKEDPTKVLGHLKKPLFSPTKDYEKCGDVPNVIFPSATTIFDERLYIYYGAADKRIAVASLDLNELLDELLAENSYGEPKYNIGFTAGEVFNTTKGKEISFEQLKEKLKKDDMLILMAIGWLAREGKVECRYINNQLRIKTRD